MIEVYDPDLPETADWWAANLGWAPDDAREPTETDGAPVGDAPGNRGKVERHGLDAVISDSERVTVDVMILYTPQARASCGKSALEDSIRMCVACANQTFRRSQIPLTLRLVHQAEVSGRAESGNHGRELSWLMNDARVRNLRNEHGADLVSLIVSRGECAGLATCSGSYSVFCGNPVTFTHEIGHNLGCGHERAQPATCSRDAYSFAHVLKPDGSNGCAFGTVMSYSGSLILNFSNPRVDFRGCPTGLPEGHRKTERRADSADNARTITAYAPETAARKPVRVGSLENPTLGDSGTTFSFDIVAHARETHSVQYTADFVHWLPLHQYEVNSDRIKVTDDVKSVDARFYRALAASNGPVNSIGFYRRQLPAGRSLVANQLDHGDNRIARLFADLPIGTVLRKWDVSAQSLVENVLEPTGWTQPDMTLHPGEGAVIQTEEPVLLTFIGEVQPAFYQPVETQWSLISSPVPQAGPLNSTLRFPKGNPGETAEILRLRDDSPDYQRWNYEAGSWQPPLEPWIEIGEAFWSYRSPNTYIWKRVLQPLESSEVLNCPEPFLTIERSPSSPVALTLHGPPAAIFQLHGSSDLRHWTPLAIVTHQAEVSVWTDPQAISHGHRFYRASRADP